MSNSPNSLESQIDNFIEHFKRSASNALDDWGQSKNSDSVQDANSNCSGDESNRNSSSDSIISGGQQQFLQFHQRTFQHQSSVTSNASVQTVVHQSIQKSINETIANCATINTCSTSMSNSFMKGSQSSGNAIDAIAMDDRLNVADVADILHHQYAVITGGRTKDGCPIITFPDHNNFQFINDYEYKKLIQYLTAVPPLQEADLGFHIVVDRRKDRWSSVKTVLLKISDFFPGIIHVVYVLRPNAFFQKAISELSTKFFKEDFKFRVILCASSEELLETIERSQLIVECGGDMIYSHHEWIQQRIALEKFSDLTRQVSISLDVFMKQIHETEFPNSVDATEQLMDEEGADYEKLKYDIVSTARHGELLLESFRSSHAMGKEFSERTGNISSIERLLVQLEETEKQFDDYWVNHLDRLKECLEMRRFEQNFKELQMVFDERIRAVSEMTEIGETVHRVDELLIETKNYEKLCQADMEEAENVIATGGFIVKNGKRQLCTMDLIQPKCAELLRVCEILQDKLKRRSEFLIKNRALMERVEKANDWCTRGVELLAKQQIERCSMSPDIAEQNLINVNELIESAKDFDLCSPIEFKNKLLESTTPETKALVTQVLQRIDDVWLMCENYTATLKKLAAKSMRPVQQVIPEPAVPIQSGSPLVIRRTKNQQLNKITGSQRPRSIDGPLDSGVSMNGDNGSSPDSDISSQHIHTESDSEVRRLKRGHVLAELLETERIYVAEMGSILKGYRDQMSSDELIHLVPTGLIGKEDVLFGNLPELFKFHSAEFLKDLESCITTTETVATCFVHRRDTFYKLYSFYCQNITRSERLRESLVDTHLFLQECQKRLGHKLPLAAYLLKPVQRITKYQLLLKDLLRYSENEVCVRELQKALDCMLIVLKCVNDSMHQIAITGFPADLTQQGELLLQDSFQVWTESKKDLRLRLKTQHRHIFLYQKAMLFCKQASKTGHNTYQYKYYLKMSQIGLTESVRGDPKRFEVWLQGRQEVHTIQAPSIEIKNKWVAEIKKVLFNQLEALKGERIRLFNHNKSLSQTLSTDSALDLPVGCNRKISKSASNSKRNSMHSDDNTVTVVGVSSSSSDHDNHEHSAWSSDYSNSEDEYNGTDDISNPEAWNHTPIHAQYVFGPQAEQTTVMVEKTECITNRATKKNSIFYVSYD